MENQKTIIYSYRYMWQTNKKGELNKTFVRVISGPTAEHDLFIENLKKNKFVVMASRLYMCEYQVNLLDIPETIKTVKKEVEKNEKS